MEHEVPTLVVVSGPAASGKTTLAVNVGELKLIPAICKDEIKESLFDSLGYETPEWAEQLEGATYELLFSMARSVLRSGCSVIIESDVTPIFRAERVRDLQAVSACKIVQITCRTDGDTLVDRFRSRMQAGGQHPGHFEAHYLEASAEFRASLQRGRSEPLDLPGNVITVDTTDFDTVDYQAIAAEI